MSATSLCNVCEKSVNNRNYMKCSFCQKDVHLKCNDLNYVDSQIIKNHLLPLIITSFTLYYQLQKYCEIEPTDTCLILKPPKNLAHLFSELNNLSSENEDSDEKHINCKYYDINQLQKIKPLTYNTTTKY